MKRVAIIKAFRSPIGNLGGSLSSLSPSFLGAQIAKKAIEEIIPQVVIIGNVLSTGLGQNIARQIALKAGCPLDTEAYTLNKVCGSGMKAIHLGLLEIISGNRDTVLTGGIEIISQAPFFLDAKVRCNSMKYSHQTIWDSLIVDALEDPFEHILMGETAEELADYYKISRQEQDDFALLSQEKALKSLKLGIFKDEVVPIEVSHHKKSWVFDQDESPRTGLSREKLLKLKPAFRDNGTVTAGNSSSLNDGVAFVLLMSEKKVKSLGIEPLAWIEGVSNVGLNPRKMGLGPVESLKSLLSQLQWNYEDLNHIELNEAFSAQALAVISEWQSYWGKKSIKKVPINPFGGSIALGHPLGATGARLVVTLAHAISRMKKGSKGVATLCIGGGQGMAIALSR